MTGLTLAISFISSAAILFSRPHTALLIYCAAVFWYPPSLVAPLGVADFNVSRIAILPLIIRIGFMGGPKPRLRWTLLDRLVLLYFIASSLAFLDTTPFMKVCEREAGAFLDTLLPYLAARLVIRSKDDMVRFVKGLVCISVPLAIGGFYESLSGHNPFLFLYRHASWGVTDRTMERFGLRRATLTFGNYIAFGMFFAMLYPLALGLVRQRVWSAPRTLVLTGILTLGVASSVSSGPLFAAAVAFVVLIGYKLRRHWRPLLVLFIVLCAGLEAYSNRHFYEVFTRLAFNAKTASYRIGLYHEAFGIREYETAGMSGYWLFGQGYVGLGSTDEEFSWRHKDITSAYISVLLRSGLLGLIPFMLVIVAYYRCIWNAMGTARGFPDKWFLWCLTASFVGFNVGTLTVGILQQTTQMYYFMMAMAARAPEAFVPKTEEPDDAPETPRRNRAHV